MEKYLVVSAGAALGGAARYWMSDYVYRIIPLIFPLGTLAVNFTGSLLLGFIIFFLDEKELLSVYMRLFLTIGFCGGFTTFSTFSFETFSLFRSSQHLLAMLNIFLNLVFTLAGIYAGFVLSKL